MDITFDPGGLEWLATHTSVQHTEPNDFWRYSGLEPCCWSVRTKLVASIAKSSDHPCHADWHKIWPNWVRTTAEPYLRPTHGAQRFMKMQLQLLMALYSITFATEAERHWKKPSVAHTCWLAIKSTNQNTETTEPDSCPPDILEVLLSRLVVDYWKDLPDPSS